MKVAYYSPLPPERSGVADYSAMLLPELQQRLEIDVVRRGARRRARRAARHADVALYHVGNDPERHWWIVEELRRRPGVVVLHDFVLHHLVAGMTIGRGDADGLPRRDAARGGRRRPDARPRRGRRTAAAGLGAPRARVPADRRGALVGDRA